MNMSVFNPDEETKRHEFGVSHDLQDDPVFRVTGLRTYLEEPLIMLNGDTLTTYEDGTVEQIRDGEVIATTRWTHEKPDYMTDKILDAFTIE